MKKKSKVNRLFELQTASGYHIAWASDEAEVKKIVARDTNAPQGEVRVYQYIGSFVPNIKPLVWKKLVR